MKKILLIIMAATLFAACTKRNAGNPGTNHNPNDTIPANTITATINRTGYVLPILSADTTYAAYSYLFIGAEDSANNEIQLEFGLPLLTVAHTYSDTSATAGSLVLRLYLSNGNLYESAGVPGSPVTVTVDTISPAFVRGTFQGTVYEDGDTTAEQQTITNGRFNINR